MIKPKGLGRGLEALLGEDRPPAPAPAVRDDRPPATLPLASLQPGRYQPRTRMDESSLQELAASIRQHGMMQPIVVRPLPAGAEPPSTPSVERAAPEGTHPAPRYEIIAGERRYRASKLAGLVDVPVIVKDVPDEHALAMALIENIQREDLNPLEEAQAIRRLIEDFGYSHEQAAEAIGRSRSATSNLLRLLNLAEPVQTMLLAGDIDMGHARALLAVDRATQLMLAQEITQKRLSVREAEKLVARHAEPVNAGSRGGARRAAAPDRDLLRMQERLCDLLGTTVRIDQTRHGGRLVIQFSGNEQFEGLLARLGYEP